jgi:hypothetical protein
MEPKTKNIVITVVVILLAIFLVGIMYFYNKPDTSLTIDNENSENNTEQPVSNLPDTSPEPLSMVQVYFNESLSIEPQGAKSQVTNGIVLPILKNIFDTIPATPEEPIVVGVKAKIATDDNNLTYVFNRICTDSDLETFKTALTGIGAVIKDSNNPIKLEYSGLTLTFNFWLNNQQQSGVEASF